MKYLKLLTLLTLLIAIPVLTSCEEDEKDQPLYIGGGGDTQAGTGLYMGVIGFNQALTTKQISILSPNTKSYFTDFVSDLTSKNGTLLYYAVDNAIEALETSTLPNDLVNVAMVTFTDGLDQGSFMMNSKYESNEEYLSAVNNKIKNTKVKGLPISAYSIGLKGSDVSDNAQFQANLINLASSRENAAEVTSMDEVNAKFQEIANQLYKENSVQSISLSIPGQADGTKIRFTFDNVTDASQSQLYIEGTFSLSERSLKDITYRGMTSGSGEVVAGVQEGIFVTFTFNDIKGKSISSVPTNKIMQWIYITGTSQWQKNSEFDPDSQTQTTVDRKSAVIMLVLDCSSSLGTQFVTMQRHANAFIKKMADGSEGSTGGGNTDYTDNVENGHEYVDLGLSVKWATCNVGATTPYGYGNYYAWGETTTRSSYSSSNYRYSSNPTTLPLSADAAHVNWGGSWRMPTYNELSELKNTNYCTWTWITLNGVKGYKVTSKKNGNSIFLPAGGWRSENLREAGSSGGYWSTSLNTSNSDGAYGVDFEWGGSVEWASYYRWYGHSIRAVCE